MSKTSQRKSGPQRQAYLEGKLHGIANLPFKWKRHPHYRAYHKGYEEGLRIRNK